MSDFGFHTTAAEVIEGIDLLKALDSPKDYHDSWHLSGGVRFHSEALGLEAMLGCHYDSTPAPDTTPLISAEQIQSISQANFGGGAETEVFAPLPASRSPFELHITILPPCSVMMRLCATRTL